MIISQSALSRQNNDSLEVISSANKDLLNVVFFRLYRRELVTNKLIMPCRRVNLVLRGET